MAQRAASLCFALETQIFVRLSLPFSLSLSLLVCAALLCSFLTVWLIVLILLHLFHCFLFLILFALCCSWPCKICWQTDTTSVFGLSSLTWLHAHTHTHRTLTHTRTQQQQHLYTISWAKFSLVLIRFHCLHCDIWITQVYLFFLRRVLNLKNIPYQQKMYFCLRSGKKSSTAAALHLTAFNHRLTSVTSRRYVWKYPRKLSTTKYQMRNTVYQ